MAFQNVLPELPGAHRTSSTAWCTDKCYNRPLVIELMETYASMRYAKGDDEAANAVVREIACKRLVKDVVSNVGEGRVGVAKQQAVEEVPQKSGWLWW